MLPSEVRKEFQGLLRLRSSDSPERLLACLAPRLLTPLGTSKYRGHGWTFFLLVLTSTQHLAPRSLHEQNFQKKVVYKVLTVNPFEIL